MSWLTRLETKGGVTFIPADAAYNSGTLPRTNYPYGRDVGQGLDSNVVMAPVFWVTRNFTQAIPAIERRRGALWEIDPGHPLEPRLRAPNPFYSGRTLWKALLLSWLLDGNAYWQKVRNRFGEIIGYWYIPHFLIEPKWPSDGSTFISHYEYKPRRNMGDPIDLPVRDVVHFRYEGVDPRNDRKGLSPLKMLLREVFTDEEASNFAASILRNMGVPGGIIAPAGSGPLPKPDDVKEMKAFMKGFRGDRRGEWMVLGTPTSVERFGFDPSQLLLANLRDITEERVCALLGIPAAVVGFGAGLQTTKVGATMRELRQSAWHNALIPMQDDLAEQGGMQLIPDYNAQVSRYRLIFDRSRVSVFQEEETERAKRIAVYVEKGVLRVDKGQELAGLPVDPSQNVYLRSKNVVAVREGDPGLAAAESGTSAEPSANGGDPADDDVPLTRNRIREIIASMEEEDS